MMQGKKMETLIQLLEYLNYDGTVTVRNYSDPTDPIIDNWDELTA